MTRTLIAASIAVLFAACADLSMMGSANSQGLDADDAGEPAPADAGDATDAGPCSDGKCYVCHIPPGNPDNAHTIHVGEPAVQAHLNHGDYLGPCGDAAETDDADSDSDSDSDSDTASEDGETIDPIEPDEPTDTDEPTDQGGTDAGEPPPPVDGGLLIGG